MTDKEVILAQRKHYADAIEKCARLADVEGLEYLAKAIRQIAWLTGLEVLKMNVFHIPSKIEIPKEEPKEILRVSNECLQGRKHRFRNSNICKTCGAKRFFERKRA